MEALKNPETRLLEAAGAEVEAEVEAALAADEEVLIRVWTDMEALGRFGRQWLILTPRRVLLWSPEGLFAAADGSSIAAASGRLLEVGIEEIAAVRTEALVGGGRLEIERREAPGVHLLYSGSLAAKFSEVARGLEQLRKGEALQVNPRLERSRCEKCRRLLPEKDGICPACIEKLATFKRIAAYMAPYKGRAALMALSSIAATGAELAPPMITRRIVDGVLVPTQGSAAGLDERLGLLGLLVLGLVGARALGWCAEWVHGWVMSWLGAQVTADVRSQLYRRLEMLSLQFYDKRQVGSLMSRVTRDTGRLQDFLVDGLPYLMFNALMLFGILAFLFGLSWSLSLYIMLPVPLMLLWGTVFWGRMRRYFGKWSAVWARLTERTNEALAGIRVVKAFAQEKREIQAFARPNERLTAVAVETQINRGVFFATMSFLTGLGVLIVWLLGGREVLEGRLTLGTLLAFYSYMWMFYGPMEWMGQVNTWMMHAFAGAERIFEVIDTTPEAYEDPRALRLPRMQGHIRFKGVSFGYDKSKPVLHEIDLEVRPGEMIGLVGRSGVGKTTMVNLIARFYEVDRGALEIDGVDLRRIHLGDLRSQIGIVSQEPVLFSGTIAENIAYGRPGARFEEIMEAARIARAHSFIVAKPDGYETQVGEGGAGLSGGERQRLAIARAILHDPRILILDEATSSVDVQTEKQIQAAVAHLVRGRTTVAIAHRLSTLRNADRLVVLDQGRIVERGTHAELMEKRGAFYRLVQLQRAVAQIIAVKE